MKQTSKKLKVTLAVALFLCIAANVAGTVYAQDMPARTPTATISQ